MILILVNITRFVVGFILMAMALRAFLKTRTSGMLYLTLGFTMLTLGNAFSAVLYMDNVFIDNLLSDSFDILGMVALIVAVRIT